VTLKGEPITPQFCKNGHQSPATGYGLPLGGRRQGAKPLRFAAPPSGGAGRVESVARFFRFFSLDRLRPCRRPLQFSIRQGPLFQAWNSSATCSFKWSLDASPRAPKNVKICANTPGELSREDLETQSGKSCLPEPPRVSLICLPYSKYHGFLTSQGVPPGFLWAPFLLHFGSLLGTFGFQKSPKVRKIYFPKNIKN